MSALNVCNKSAAVLETIFVKQINSAADISVDDDSSLQFELPEVNVKRLLYDRGLCDTGSEHICTSYIPLSASSVLRHPYYNYPAIKDPGIEDALLRPSEEIKYADDGQELYIAMCKEANLSPIQIFYKNLLEDKIDLSYYGVPSMAYRAIALSLKNNRYVTVLNLTDNWITLDGCFHLGEILVDNITLRELNLYGCRIGQEGARRLFLNLHRNRSLRKLDLSCNEIGDTGVQYLATAISLCSEIIDINLKNNKLTDKAVLALSEAFAINNKLTHLDLSYNKFLSENSVFSLCKKLSVNHMFEELNLSWTSLKGRKVGKGVKLLMKNPNIKSINLSNNNLSKSVVKQISSNLKKAISLVTLNLSYNPFTPTNAFKFLTNLLDRKVKLQNLLLDNVVVSEDFMQLRKSVLALPFRKDAVITNGYVNKKIVTKPVDMKEIVLNRIDYLCKKSKRRYVDFALLIQTLYKISSEPMDINYFARELTVRGARLDKDLVDNLCNLFAGPRTKKAKFINLHTLVEYLQRKWPDRKLPPTPPPEPEPEPQPEPEPKVEPKTPKKNKKK